MTNCKTFEYLFPQVYEKFIETFILTAICIAAFGGNTSLWIIVLRDKSLRNSSSTLLLCLSAADWLVSVVNMPIIGNYQNYQQQDLLADLREGALVTPTR